MSEKVEIALPKGLRLLIQETCVECRKQNRFCGMYGSQKVCLRIVEDKTSANGIAIDMKPSCELGKYIPIGVSETLHITEMVKENA